VPEARVGAVVLANQARAAGSLGLRMLRTLLRE
jgi:hypothetical protein